MYASNHYVSHSKLQSPLTIQWYVSLYRAFLQQIMKVREVWRGSCFYSHGSGVYFLFLQVSMY